MTTYVSGGMTTGNVLSDQLAIDISKEIRQLEPDIQPLTIFSREAEKRRTIAVKFKWLEEEAKARFDTVSVEATAEAITITVTNGAYYQQWDQVLDTITGEQFRVDSVNGNVLTVTRGIGSTAKIMKAEDELYIIGTAQPENDTSKTARSTIPSKVENNTQIWRTPFEVSGSLMASGFMVNPAEWPRQARAKGIEHAKDIELSALLGRKSATTPGSTEDRTTGGALSFITSNQTDAGGELSEPEWNAFLASVMRYGQKGKLGLGSATAVNALQKFPASKLITKQDESTYGLNVAHFTSPFGSINLVYHRLLTGAKYGGYLIILDMTEIAWRPLGNDTTDRDTKVLPNRQPNDQDGQKNEYLTEAGLEFGSQRKHGVVTGITS